MDEPDPFAFLITGNCHVTASQERLLLSAAAVRNHDRFLDESESQYYIPVETNVIRMESPPEDEYLTPREDSLPPASSSDGESAPPMSFLRDLVPPLAAAVDLGRDSDSLGFGVGNSTVVIESGDLECNTDEFMVVERETRRMREICTEPECKKSRVSEGFKGAGVGTMVVDWDEDQVFDKIPMRSKEVKMDVHESTSFEAADLDEDNDILVRKQGWKMGSRENNCDEDQVFGKMPMRSKEVKMGVSESTSFEAADLGEDNDILVRKQGSKMGSSENTNTQFVDIDKQELKLDPVEVTCTQVMDLDEDEALRNRDVEMDTYAYMSADVINLDKNETCDDSAMQDTDAESVCIENKSTKVVDLDEDELYSDLTMRNRVLSEKVIDQKNDENRDFGDDIEKIDKFENVSQKGISIGGNSDTYDICDDSCRDENIEFNRETNRGPVEKNTNKIEKSNCADQTNNEERKSDENRDFGDDIEKIDKFENVPQKGITIGGSNDMYDIRDDSCRDTNIECNRETNRGPVEKNTSNIDKSNCADQTSEEGTKSDEIMKNLLDALDLIIEDKKEKKVDGDDGADEGLDFWQTAMLRGVKFAHPSWWPPQEPDD